MHYLDQNTFWAVLTDVWKRNGLSSGMTADQLRMTLSAREASSNCECGDSLARSASIRFLEDERWTSSLREARSSTSSNPSRQWLWPYQNNRTSIAGGSRALFLGAQTNRGLHNGCVVTTDLPGTIPGGSAESARVGSMLLKEVTLFGSVCDSTVGGTRAEQA